MVSKSWPSNFLVRRSTTMRSNDLCHAEEITPLFLGRYSTSTTRMTLVALGTCLSCSKSGWIETEFDASTTSLSQHLTSSCTWNSTELVLILHTPMHYKLITSRGSMRSTLLSKSSLRFPPLTPVHPSK